MSHPSQYELLGTVLAISIESLRLSATLLRPIMPGSCEEILARIGLGNFDEGEELQCWLEEGMMERCDRKNLVLGGQPLFNKIRE